MQPNLDKINFSSPKESRRALSQKAGGVTVQHKRPAFNTLITLSEAAPLVSLRQGDNSLYSSPVLRGGALQGGGVCLVNRQSFEKLRMASEAYQVDCHLLEVKPYKQ